MTRAAKAFAANIERQIEFNREHAHAVTAAGSLVDAHGYLACAIGLTIALRSFYETHQEWGLADDADRTWNVLRAEREAMSARLAAQPA